MGGLFGKGPGRTLECMSTNVSDACWSSLYVKSSHPHKMLIQSPSEALKNGLPMPVYATTKLTIQIMNTWSESWVVTSQSLQN